MVPLPLPSSQKRCHLTPEQQQTMLFVHIGRVMDQYVSLGTEELTTTAQVKSADRAQNNYCHWGLCMQNMWMQFGKVMD